MSDDELVIRLYSASDPLAEGTGRLRDLIGIFEAHGLGPDAIPAGKTVKPFSIDAATRAVSTRSGVGGVTLNLMRRAEPAGGLSLLFLATPRPMGFYVNAHTRLANWERVPDLLRELAKLSDPLYGFAHCKSDFALSSDPHTKDPTARLDVYEPYWLNVYGKTMVDKLGRERVATTPATHVEWIAGDAAMIQVGKTPVDYATHDARRMQASVMVHLRGVAFEAELGRLEERSRKLAPVAPTWRAEVDDLFSEVLDRAGRTGRATETQRLNALSVPEPTEWRLAAEQLAPDIDVAKALDRYETYAEQLVALLHTKVRDIGKALPEVLPQIDHELWLYDYPTHAERRDIENDLVPAVGGYLGQMLVERLGGRWVPRRTLDESQVVIGDRAWLPFVRARHYLASRDSILTHSLTLFFRVAGAVD